MYVSDDVQHFLSNVPCRFPDYRKGFFQQLAIHIFSFRQSLPKFDRFGLQLFVVQVFNGLFQVVNGLDTGLYFGFEILLDFSLTRGIVLSCQKVVKGAVKRRWDIGGCKSGEKRTGKRAGKGLAIP